MGSFQHTSKLQATSYLPYKAKFVSSAQKRPGSSKRNDYHTEKVIPSIK
jgi:hypothetical protein